jgi:acyl-coenzyme A thioesterase PaaI-like protein
MPSTYAPINFKAKLEMFQELWSPKIIAAMNNYHLQGLLSGHNEPSPIPGLVGHRLVAVIGGRTHFKLAPHPRHTIPFSTVHGGILTTLLDTAMTSAVWSTLAQGQAVATLALNVN